MDARQERGLELATAVEIRRKGKAWLVPSQRGGKCYAVDLEKQCCTCPDYGVRKVRCKHLFAVEYTLKKRATYTQNWPAYNAAQSEEKSRFMVLLSDLCRSIPQPEQTNGRPRLPLSDMVFATVLKIYCGFSSRRFTCDLKEAHRSGFVYRPPHFNSLNRYLADPELTEVLKNLVTVSSLPLKAVETDFAVDSSGFSTCRSVRWFNKKHGRETDNRTWVKCHLMCGTKTQIVTAVDISGWAAHDTNFFIPLIQRTAEHFPVREVAADKAYLSHRNLRAVELAGGMPFIPFKSNTLEPTEGSMWARMYHLFMHKREPFMERYHRRSNIESAYSMIKGKFGSSLRSKSATGQINEALCKVLAHNICVLIQEMHELGIEPAF